MSQRRDGRKQAQDSAGRAIRTGVPPVEVAASLISPECVGKVIPGAMGTSYGALGGSPPERLSAVEKFSGFRLDPLSSASFIRTRLGQGAKASPAFRVPFG